jgi:hypothetical protein
MVPDTSAKQQNPNHVHGNNKAAISHNEIAFQSVEMYESVFVDAHSVDHASTIG